MDDHSLLMAVSALIGALGIKEVWGLVSKKMDIGATKSERKFSVYAQNIEALTNKITELEAKIEVQIGHKVNINSELTKAENDLKLMIAYQVNQIRTADEAQREWTGKERTYEVDRVRDQIREPREKKNRFAGSDEMSKMDANESSEDLVVAEE